MKNTNENITKKINIKAKEYVLSYGIHGWNMNDFASAVGITKRTLYKYVENKEALVQNVLLAYIRNIQVNLHTLLAEAEDFHSGMQSIIKVYPSMVIQMDSKIIQDIFLQYPYIENRLFHERKKLTSEISNFILEAQKKKQIRDAYSSDEILELIQSLIFFHAKHHPDQLEEKLRNGISMLYYGLSQ